MFHIYMVDTYYIRKCALHSEWVSIKRQGKEWSMGNFSDGVQLIGTIINPLNAELNPICCLLALLGAHHFLHISRIRVESLTLRLLMSYMEHPFLMFLDHTQRRSTVGRTPLDE